MEILLSSIPSASTLRTCTPHPCPDYKLPESLLPVLFVVVSPVPGMWLVLSEYLLNEWMSLYFIDEETKFPKTTQLIGQLWGTEMIYKVFDEPKVLLAFRQTVSSGVWNGC